MDLLRAIVMAFSLFSTIPMPTIQWDERNMRFMMAAFPLVGAVIGLLVWGWQLLAQALGLGTMLTGAGYTLIPIVVTGGIHMDGFADVMDAQSSHASPEQRQRIMRDPHIGAFATIAVTSYLIAYFALACEIPAQRLVPLACIPVISRCLSGLATVSFRTASDQGMLASEQTSARTGVVRTVLAAVLAIAFSIMVTSAPCVSIAMLMSAVGVLVWVKWLADKYYGGMSGDLAGFYLQTAELAMLACIAIVGRLV